MELSDFLTKVTTGERTVFDVVKEADGERKLTIDVRKLHPEEPRAPKRAESPGRRHEFLSAGSLADYLARYGGETTVVFADPALECISAVIDEDAADGFEIVTMKPQVHPLWKPWADLAGKKIEIEAFAEFVLQNRRSITRPAGRDLALLLSQITASVEVEIQKGRGRSSINGLKITTEIQAGRTQEDAVELPEEIVLHVPLYVQTEASDVELDLCVEANAAGEVLVLVTAGTVADARVRAFEEMVDLIRQATTAKGSVLTYGRPQHAARAYLPELQADGRASAPTSAADAKPVYPR